MYFSPRNARKSRTKKGVSPVDLKRFKVESKEKGYPPSREGTESREGRRGPCSCRSGCSRFRILNQSDHCISNREMRENRDTICGLFFLVRTVRVVRGSWNSKGVSAINLTAKHAKIAKVLWSISLCSYRLRCSRFIEFKGSVRCNFNSRVLSLSPIRGFPVSTTKRGNLCTHCAP